MLVTVIIKSKKPAQSRPVLNAVGSGMVAASSSDALCFTSGRCSSFAAAAPNSLRALTKSPDLNGFKPDSRSASALVRRGYQSGKLACNVTCYGCVFCAIMGLWQ